MVTLKDCNPLNMKSSAFPFISLSFCSLITFVGSGVTYTDLHASFHCHSNNFICSYYVKARCIRFHLVVIPGSRLLLD